MDWYGLNWIGVASTWSLVTEMYYFPFSVFLDDGKTKSLSSSVCPTAFGVDPNQTVGDTGRAQYSTRVILYH